MIGVFEASVGFLLMLGLMLIGLPVAISLFLTAFIGAWAYLGWPTLLGFGNQIVQIDPGSNTVVVRLGTPGRPGEPTFGAADAARVVTEAITRR